jgi:hypothetical protein
VSFTDIREKVVPFEKLILKSVNKIKIGQFLTKLRKYVFCHFPNFTDFERAVTLLLVKIILNFKTLCECEYRTQFLPWFCVATENIQEGGESVRKELSQQFTCP